AAIGTTRSFISSCHKRHGEFTRPAGRWRKDKRSRPQGGESTATRANAGRSVHRASQLRAFGADERSRPASGAELTTDATLRSATPNALPRRYCRPASAPSRTRSGVLKRSAASSAFFGSRCSREKDQRCATAVKHRLLQLGDRPVTPLE